MRKIKGTALFSLLVGAAAACGGGSDPTPPGDLFPPKPECEGAAVSALQGMQPQVINKLEIGKAADGFDLDNDGVPDNKLAAVASIAKSAIEISPAKNSWSASRRSITP